MPWMEEVSPWHIQMWHKQEAQILGQLHSLEQPPCPAALSLEPAVALGAALAHQSSGRMKISP